MNIKQLSKNIIATLIQAFFIVLMVMNLLGLIVLFDYEFNDPANIENTFKISDALLSALSFTAFIGIFVAIAIAVVWGWTILFQNVFYDKTKKFRTVVERSETFPALIFWTLIGLFAIGFIVTANEIVGFITLVFYIAVLSWYLSDKIKEQLIIFNNPDLLKLHEEKNETQLELNKFLDEKLNVENDEPVKVLYRKLALLTTKIDNYEPNIS